MAGGLLPFCFFYGQTLSTHRRILSIAYTRVDTCLRHLWFSVALNKRDHSCAWSTCRMMRPRTYLFVLCWIALAVALPLAGPTLNGAKPWGVPLGYFMSAQGGPLLLLAILAWMGMGRGRA
jgi:putative solute:sodium symporter small subunit